MKALGPTRREAVSDDASQTLAELVRSVTGGELLSKRPFLIADDLETQFLRAGWPAGRSFGGEAALAERYGVGRDVLREVVRVLEARQHARMRRGPQGGLEVIRPDLEDLCGRLNGYAYVSELDRVSVLETWTILMAVAVRLLFSSVQTPLAARDRLVALFARPDLSLRRIGTDLIAASASPLLVELGACVASLLPRWADAALEAAWCGAPWRRTDFGLDATVWLDWIHQIQLPWVLVQMGETSDERHIAPPRAPSDHSFKAQAMQVVHSLMSATPPHVWNRGHLIGNEFDLADRFGVDKSIIRQAVRLMEDAETAVALPGRGGGLVTRLPSTAPLSRLFCAYFVAHDLDEADGERVFGALRIECAGLAAERADLDDRIALLQLREDLGDLQGALPVAVLQSFERFQQHAAHNTLLGLCIDSVKAFMTWRMDRQLVAPEAVTRLYRMHTQRVVRAICAQDRAGAMVAEHAKLEGLARARKANVGSKQTQRENAGTTMTSDAAGLARAASIID